MKKVFIILLQCLAVFLCACSEESGNEDTTDKGNTGKTDTVATYCGTSYYVDPTAVNDSGDGSITAPFKTITAGISKLKSGDNLILKDGIYTGTENYIGDNASPRVYPPSGTASCETVIIAQHEGMAILDGEYSSTPFSFVNSIEGVNYLHVSGIHFRRGKSAVFNIKGKYNRVTKCGFEDGMAPDATTETPIAFVAGGSEYTLIENSWVWGRGRYGLYTSSTSGGTNNVIFRRVVVRLDDTPSGWITAGLRFYNGKKQCYAKLYCARFTYIRRSQRAYSICPRWWFINLRNRSYLRWSHRS
jgi:hypothetical protein